MRITRITLCSASTIDGLPTLDNLFDAKNGINNIPNSAEVEYRGFTVYMKPSEFLHLAAHSSSLNSDFYAKQIENGNPLGYCTLDVEPSKDKTSWSVIGHEGRNRCVAIQKVYGDRNLIPVHIIPQYIRNRSLTPEMLEWPFIPQDGAITSTPIKFKMSRVDKNSSRFNYGRYEIKVKVGKHPSFAAVRWSSDLMIPASPCNLKKVQKNEDDVQEVLVNNPQPMHIYHNYSPAPHGTKISRRGN